MKRLVLATIMIFAFNSIVFAETPDECASRLDLDIRVETFAQATAWYEQVQRECAQPPEGEGLLRLELDKTTILPVTNCSIYYGEARTWDDVWLVPRLFEGSIKLHTRHGVAGDWTELIEGEIRTVTGGDEYNQFTAFDKPETLGAGLHQFELRTRSGADKFEIMETWGALYLIDIKC